MKGFRGGENPVSPAGHGFCVQLLSSYCCNRKGKLVMSSWDFFGVVRNKTCDEHNPYKAESQHSL